MLQDDAQQSLQDFGAVAEPAVLASAMRARRTPQAASAPQPDPDVRALLVAVLAGAPG